MSTATVSRTLNQSGPVKAATARKVWRAVTEMNYYPNSHARALVSGRSRLIGLIVSDITNPFFPELIRAFQDLAAQKQSDVLLTSTDYLTSRMTECLRRMLERKVDGVAMMTSEMDLGLIKELSRRNVPIVFMDVGQMGPRMSHVAIDYGNGIRQAVDHVAETRTSEHRLHQRPARSSFRADPPPGVSRWPATSRAHARSQVDPRRHAHG